MQATIHGNALGPVRNDYVSGAQAEDLPEVQLVRARARHAELKRKHAEAQATFKAAVRDDNSNHDLQALKSNVRRLASELEAASDEVSLLENLATQQKLNRLPQLVVELRAQREEFTRLYRATCAALGRVLRERGRSNGARQPRNAHERPELQPAPQRSLGTGEDAVPFGGFCIHACYAHWLRLADCGCTY